MVSSFFQMVNSASEVQEGTILEVVINTQPLGKRIYIGTISNLDLEMNFLFSS
jgi:hypothetical protein